MPEKVRDIYNRSCQSCHGIDGRGIAGIAPDLAKANRRSVEDWVRYLQSPQRAHPVSQHPPLWPDREEVRMLAEFLTTIPKNDHP